MPKVSVICTTYNEAESILDLLLGLANQVHQADEILICDAKSSDGTARIIKQFAKKNPKLHIKIITKKGNRSIGRNAAITAAKFPLIAITDAGCVPEKNWLKELLKKYEKSKAPVVAGYYRGLVTTEFEEAVVPYALVMPDKLPKDVFLPATRSMLIEKKVWKQLDGFDESLHINEDYLFARKLQKQGITIVFAKKAIVEWMPRKNLKDFYKMIYLYAQGDIAAKVIRPKVVLIFVRYLLLLLVCALLLLIGNLRLLAGTVMVLGGIYAIWSVQKNIRYTPNGWLWLPLLQITSDVAVMLGSISAVKNFFK